ncbi:chemotaxis protein CheA [Parachryseolinea silvisoli]|uniref:chemotaxis protein CheA n=1 Tax=Parachryseolinea silvisoli TaxID=2873601 RepID=UPI002265C16B|nr:chemotaxis protein CheA [Parachryseolinea silvisoli]MCD9015854.1 chemotaxis protein CheA [Parachryseolinea silvisoli]
MKKDQEYKEIFLAESLENFEEINRLLTQLEKHPSEKNTLHALFRITHTLKGNAAGMGFTGIAELAHVLEDLFGEVRDGNIVMDRPVFEPVFKGVDVLGALINAVRDNADVKYKGIKTKLEVIIRTKGIARSEEGRAAVGEAAPEVMAATEATLAVDGREAEETEETRIAFSDLVQVPVRKLDNLLNLVGELIIEKDRILAQAGNHTRGTNEYARLSRISADLQYSVMDVRMVQVGFLFNKFHRVVRDAAVVENKNVTLKLEGTDTEIDRNVLQVMSDSLIHLIRNSIGHGVESAEERQRLGKPAAGVITLRATGETDSVVIEITDDGKGLDYEKIKRKALSKGLITQDEADRMPVDELGLLIFEPGFSTADQVTAISGRGVGMDVVKKTLDSIGAMIRVDSKPGLGTTVRLTLPSSMAVKSCLLFEMQQDVYAIPLSFTEAVISLYKTNIHKAGGGLIANHLGKNIAVVFLKDVFDQDLEKHIGTNLLQKTFDEIHPEAKLEIVVVTFNNRTVGFVVDKLLQQKEIVEKPLMKPVDRVKFIGGVTILGSGNVCLVLNVPFILQFIFGLYVQGRSTKGITLN